MERGDVVGVADALGDLAYVVYGAALHFGIDLDAVVAEIHRSNMTKTPAGNGKAVKGPEYRAPDLRKIVARTAEEGTALRPERLTSCWQSRANPVEGGSPARGRSRSGVPPQPSD